LLMALRVDANEGLLQLAAVPYDETIIGWIRTLPQRHYRRETQDWITPARREHLQMVCGLIAELEEHGIAVEISETAAARLTRVDIGRAMLRDGAIEIAGPYSERRLPALRALPERRSQIDDLASGLTELHCGRALLGEVEQLLGEPGLRLARHCAQLRLGDEAGDRRVVDADDIHSEPEPFDERCAASAEWIDQDVRVDVNDVAERADDLGVELSFVLMDPVRPVARRLTDAVRLAERQVGQLRGRLLGWLDCTERFREPLKIRCPPDRALRVSSNRDRVPVVGDDSQAQTFKLPHPQSPLVGEQSVTHPRRSHLIY